jgi:hypothetical protein
MPLYLTDVVGYKFGDNDNAGNSHFSLGELVDFDNLGNYRNFIVKWSDKSGENFPDRNYHYLPQESVAIIPVKGFYNNQYSPTILIFTENTISRVVIDDETNTLAGANKIVGEFSGNGCHSERLISRYGDVAFWYNKGKKSVFMYNGERPQNISEGKVNFTLPTLLFVNEAERQVIVVDTGKQYIYSIEGDRWYSATGLDVTAETTIEDGQSLINSEVVVDGISLGYRLNQYPSTEDTDEQTILKTKKYNCGGAKFDRVKIDFDGNVERDIEIDIVAEHKGVEETKSFTAYPNTSYGAILPRLNFLHFVLTTIDDITSIDFDIRS